MTNRCDFLAPYIRGGSDGVIAFSLDDVLSAEECEEWIALSEVQGYEPALIKDEHGNQVLDVEVRKTNRCMLLSPEKTQVLFHRLQYKLDFYDGLKPKELNPLLRFLRYESGDYFRPHRDLCHLDETTRFESGLTIQLYLNDGFEGGETVFMDDDNAWKHAYVPKKGSALIFDQELLHCGNEVTKGKKYCVRTDVMFQF